MLFLFLVFLDCLCLLLCIITPVIAKLYALLVIIHEVPKLNEAIVAVLQNRQSHARTLPLHAVVLTQARLLTHHKLVIIVVLLFFNLWLLFLNILLLTFLTVDLMRGDRA